MRFSKHVFKGQKNAMNKKFASISCMQKKFLELYMVLLVSSDPQIFKVAKPNNNIKILEIKDLPTSPCYKSDILGTLEK